MIAPDELLRRLIESSPYLVALLACCLVVLICAALLAPIAVLTWWAGWFGHNSRPQQVQLRRLAGNTSGEHAHHFLVYLSGMGDISGSYASPYETAFLEAIAARAPGLAIVEDVFAFSVTHQDMTTERLVGWFWRWVHAVRLRRGPLKLVGQLVFIRNILQIGISADRRYGPIYNYGAAEMMMQGLLRKGYQIGSGVPITLLGYSGGGQIALGAAKYLQATLNVPVQVISLAGVMNSDRSLDVIERLYHLYGSADRLQRLGDWLFPARWPIFLYSRWNRGLASGKIVLINTGPMEHDGRRSYLDNTAHLADGTSYRDYTATLIARLVESRTG